MVSLCGGVNPDSALPWAPLLSIHHVVPVYLKTNLLHYTSKHRYLACVAWGKRLVDYKILSRGASCGVDKKVKDILRRCTLVMNMCLCSFTTDLSSQ